MSHQIDQEIGARLSARRREIGLTVEALAAALNLPAEAVRDYEAGATRLSARILQSCCRELNVSPSYFLGPAPEAAEDGRGQQRDELLSDAHRLHRAFFRIESPKLRKILVDLAVAFAEGGTEAVELLTRGMQGAADNLADLRVLRQAKPGVNA